MCSVRTETEVNYWFMIDFIDETGRKLELMCYKKNIGKKNL